MARMIDADELLKRMKALANKQEDVEAINTIGDVAKIVHDMLIEKSPYRCGLKADKIIVDDIFFGKDVDDHWRDKS